MAHMALLPPDHRELTRFQTGILDGLRLFVRGTSWKNAAVECCRFGYFGRVGYGRPSPSTVVQLNSTLWHHRPSSGGRAVQGVILLMASLLIVTLLSTCGPSAQDSAAQAAVQQKNARCKELSDQIGFAIAAPPATSVTLRPGATILPRLLPPERPAGASDESWARVMESFNRAEDASVRLQLSMQSDYRDLRQDRIDAAQKAYDAECAPGRR